MTTKLRWIAASVLVCLSPMLAVAQKQDIPGSADHPLISRYPGSVIIEYTVKEYDEFVLPLGKLNPPGPSFAKSEKVEGKVTRILYEFPENRSTLEVQRNYEGALKRAGFEILFTCAMEEQCGYGDTHLTGDKTERWWSGERHLSSKLSRAEGNVYVSVHIYGTSHRVLQDVIETKPMDTGLITVTAAALASDITRIGHAPVYGIYFDTGKADIKPDSEPTLKEIAKLTQQNARLKLYVVGHTDNVGGLAMNMELSRRRADSVVAALTTKYGVAADRLQSYGNGPLAPVSSNKSEEGRAKNRRVELVEQ